MNFAKFLRIPISIGHLRTTASVLCSFSCCPFVDRSFQTKVKNSTYIVSWKFSEYFQIVNSCFVDLTSHGCNFWSNKDYITKRMLFNTFCSFSKLNHQTDLLTAPVSVKFDFVLCWKFAMSQNSCNVWKIDSKRDENQASEFSLHFDLTTIFLAAIWLPHRQT